MKKIVLTFDDGRGDNYTNVFPVMKKYGLKGTLFITSGYIDKSYTNSDWKSAGEPMSPLEIKEMKDCGFEIGLHGDRHTTDSGDFAVCLEKLKNWNLIEKENPIVGFSIPNSDVKPEKADELKNDYSKELLYIRKGRECNTEKIHIKLLFAIYNILKFSWAYRLFNLPNIIKSDDTTKPLIPSVVIKRRDSAKMIIKFIKRLPDNCICVFMLHSILYKTDKLYNTDGWAWSVDNFDTLCQMLKNDSEIEVVTLKEAIEQFSIDKKI